MLRPSIKWSALLLSSLCFLFCTGFMVSPLKVKSEAFGKDKTFAIISIMATNKITTDSQTGGVVGMFKGISKEHSFSKDSSKVLMESVPILTEEFQRSKSFQLLPKNTVVQSSAYQSLPSDKAKKWFGVKMVPAEGYKYFKSKEKIKQLAQQLNTDGVIVVSLSYNAAFTGANISGISGVGTEKGKVTLAAYALDNSGRVVWKHATEGVSKKGIMSTGGAANFEKLNSKLLEATRVAAQKLIEKLDKKTGA